MFLKTVFAVLLFIIPLGSPALEADGDEFCKQQTITIPLPGKDQSVCPGDEEQDDREKPLQKADEDEEIVFPPTLDWGYNFCGREISSNICLRVMEPSITSYNFCASLEGRYASSTTQAICVFRKSTADIKLRYLWYQRYQNQTDKVNDIIT